MAKKAASNPSKALYKIKPGDKSPNFKAPVAIDKTLTAKDLRGKAFVIYFYPKDNTPGCTLEGHDFKKLYKSFQALGCEVMGVSRDSLKSHEKFKEKCGFPFELLSDEDESVCRAFDVIQMKSLYGRKFEGIERSTFVVDGRGIIRAEWRKVKVKGHADEVLKFVKEHLGAG